MRIGMVGARFSKRVYDTLLHEIGAFSRAWYFRGVWLKFLCAAVAANRVRAARSFRRDALEPDCCGGKDAVRSRGGERCAGSAMPNLLAASLQLCAESWLFCA